jgi:hypothetical protein
VWSICGTLRSKFTLVALHVLPLTAPNRSYNALVSIGPYAFLLSLDTASSDTWVVSSDCRTASCRDLPVYSANLPSASFASVADNTTAFHVGFADGTSANGFVARETLSVGGFALSGQAFGE